MTNEIFDLSNVDDLPNTLRGEILLLKEGRSGYNSKIIGIFKKAMADLTIDEVLVAYYRLYGREKLRAQISVKLYTMSHARVPRIERVRRGVYRLSGAKKDVE